jgi:curved DNA-binding protein CbpA
MTSEQAFEILGISDHNIDEASLKKAFYSAARKTHPDSNPLDEEAEEKFRLINEAYDVLCDYLKCENVRIIGTPGKSKHYGNSTYGGAAGRTYGRKTQHEAGANGKAGKKQNRTAAYTTGTGRSATGKAAESSAGSKTDVWKAYEEADQRFARQRHEDASEKAEETIRNHMIRESEEAIRNARERDAADRKAQAKAKAKAAGKTGPAKPAAKSNKAVTFWNRKIRPNHKLKFSLFILLISAIVIWVVMVIYGAKGSFVKVVETIAAIAKWILIVWMSCKITEVVQRNWKNRILSAFAFLISMEMEIILMNFLEDIVRAIAVHPGG